MLQADLVTILAPLKHLRVLTAPLRPGNVQASRNVSDWIAADVWDEYRHIGKTTATNPLASEINMMGGIDYEDRISMPVPWLHPPAIVRRALDLLDGRLSSLRCFRMFFILAITAAHVSLC